MRKALRAFTLALATVTTASRAEAAPQHAKVRHHIKCDCWNEFARKCIWQDDGARFESRPGDWYLHRPSTPEERAETADLNRQALTLGQPAYQAPAVGESVVREQGYERALREYRAARRLYYRQMREYFKQMRNSHAPQHYESREQYFSAPVAPIPPVAPRYIPSPPPYQDERLDPWHGYNHGPGNGY